MRIDYDGKQDLTTLTTRAVVRRLQGLTKVQDEVHGSVITYDGQKDFYTAKAGKDVAGPGNPTGRVRAMLAPRNGGAAPLNGALGHARSVQHHSRNAAAVNSPAMPHRKPDGESSSLAVRNLKKRYGSRTVVKDVSLDVKSGEVVGLLGPNGAGKTTSFYMIVGLVPLDAGEIALDGTSISLLPIHQRAHLGLVVSAAGSIGIPQAHRRAEHSRRAGTANRRIRQAAVERRHHTSAPKRCSTNSRSRICAKTRRCRCRAANGGASKSRARSRPIRRFILLDEPFAGVDPIAVLEIQKIVKFLKQRNIGVLITDHNVRETLGICDHAYIISDGSVLAAGAPGEIIENESVRRVYLGEHFRM